MTEGFIKLGELLAGGGVDREAAFNEGMGLGLKNQQLRATTRNALAQARLRINKAEAQEKVEGLAEEMGVDASFITAALAGINPEQLTGAAGDIQTQDFKAGIADLGNTFEQRQAFGHANKGGAVDPYQFGPGGELVTDRFNPELQLTPTGGAQIGADNALADARTELARLREEKRLHPDRFKATSKTGADGTSLVERLLGPTEAGISIVPSNLEPEKAFGFGSIIRGGINRIGDFVGLGNYFPEQAQAENFTQELSSRIQIAMRADVYRPNVQIQGLLKVYAEDPSQWFRGGELALINLQTTLRAMERSLGRVKIQLEQDLTKTDTAKLSKQLFFLADTVADIQAIEKLMSQPETDTPDADAEGWIKLPNGASYRVNPDG